MKISRQFKNYQYNYDLFKLFQDYNFHLLSLRLSKMSGPGLGSVDCRVRIQIFKWSGETEPSLLQPAYGGSSTKIPHENKKSSQFCGISGLQACQAASLNRELNLLSFTNIFSPTSLKISYIAYNLFLNSRNLF